MCIANSKTVPEYARRFAHRHSSSLGPGSEKKWCETHTYKPNGKWDRVAEDMIINLSESGHPVFREPSALERGVLRSKGKRELYTYFRGDEDTAEVLRTSIPVHELSIYGAVADMCDELACRISDCSERTRKLGAQKNTETMVTPTELSTTNKTPRTNEAVQGDMLHDCERKFANLPDHLQLITLCFQCRYHEDRGEVTALHDPRRCGFGQIGGLMSYT